VHVDEQGFLRCHLQAISVWPEDDGLVLQGTIECGCLRCEQLAVSMLTKEQYSFSLADFSKEMSGCAGGTFCKRLIDVFG
jgi:hypothetical protein